MISEGNTDEEMDDKLQKYFQAGLRLVWYVYPETRSAKVYTSPHDVTEIDEGGFLEGGDVLPGFRLSLRELFEKGRREGPAANAGR